MTKKQVIALAEQFPEEFKLDDFVHRLNVMEAEGVDENGFLLDMPGWTPEALDAALEEGENSGPAKEMDWDAFRKRMREKYTKHGV